MEHPIQLPSLQDALGVLKEQTAAANESNVQPTKTSIDTTDINTSKDAPLDKPVENRDTDKENPARVLTVDRTAAADKITTVGSLIPSLDLAVPHKEQPKEDTPTMQVVKQIKETPKGTLKTIVMTETTPKETKKRGRPKKLEENKETKVRKTRSSGASSVDKDNGSTVPKASPSSKTAKTAKVDPKKTKADRAEATTAEAGAAAAGTGEADAAAGNGTPPEEEETKPTSVPEEAPAEVAPEAAEEMTNKEP
jgi:hypothetical protein